MLVVLYHKQGGGNQAFGWEYPGQYLDRFLCNWVRLGVICQNVGRCLSQNGFTNYGRIALEPSGKTGVQLGS